MKTFKFICIFILFSSIAHAQMNLDRTWGTYFGGNTFVITNSERDTYGNIYAIGTVTFNESLGYYNSFTTPGAYQISLNGGKDGIIAKFSAEGELLWSTYLGTEGDDLLYCIALDSSQNVYVSGYMKGTNGIVTLPADFPQQNFPNCNYKGFLSKFSPDGAYLWGKPFPGVICSMAFNDQDELYVVGGTLYDNMATTGALHENIQFSSPATANNPSEAFVAKFSTTFNKLWWTYYGITTRENKIKIDSQGSVYVSGIMGLYDGENYYSTDYYSTPGCFQNFETNLIASYLSKFSTDGLRLWSTYYGTAGDYSNRTEIVNFSIAGQSIYLTGQTNSLYGISTVGCHQFEKGGEPYDPNWTIEEESFDGFLTKFNLDGDRVWGTYFGGDKNDYTSDMSVQNEMIYISGTTRSENNIASATPYQAGLTPPLLGSNPNVHENKYDAFIGIFDEQGALQNSTYYGGSKAEQYGSSNILVGNNSDIYLLGTTSSLNNIATTGSFQPEINFGTNANIGMTSPSAYNIYLARFDPENLDIDENVFSGLQLFPNPNKGVFTVTGNLSDQTTISIFDIQGRKVFFYLCDTSTNLQIDLQGQVQSGLYFVTFIENGNSKVFKMLVQ